MTAATMKTSSTTPAARASAHSASRITRQRDELDPARDDDGRGDAWRRLGHAPGQDRKRSVTSILFIGDVVGGLGRRTLLGLLPELREELEPTFVVVNGENSAGRPRHHAADRPRDARRRRRRDHARQPRLPPPRDPPLPRRGAADHPARPTTCAATPGAA